VDQLIVAVNKMDACGYAQGVFEGVKAKLAPLLKQSGYRESAATFVPLSGLQGRIWTRRRRPLSSKPGTPAPLCWRPSIGWPRPPGTSLTR